MRRNKYRILVGQAAVIAVMFAIVRQIHLDFHVRRGRRKIPEGQGTMTV